MNSMLEETLKPGATMDGIYRLQRHIYDITRRYFLLGRDQLLDGLDIPENGTALELGSGTGRNLIGAARRYPSARLYGLDISEEMLKSASSKITREDFRQRIILAHADATNFSAQKVFGTAKFDRVFFSYTISMIPNWQAAIEQALSCLAKGGELHIVDFGQCAGLPHWFCSGLFAWLNLFHVSPRQQLISHAKRVASAKGMSFTCESQFRDYAWLIKVTNSI
jgi:S-adenosylmethionine-diacylgycerolhomoserine-N-methlytransferase